MKPGDEVKVLHNQRWLAVDEIEKHLEKVQFIVMAQPNIDERNPSRTHFTFFFNTRTPLPNEIIHPILEKLTFDYTLHDVRDFYHNLGDVAFAVTSEATPMPYFIPSPLEGGQTIDEAQTVKMHIFELAANPKEGLEEIRQGLMGWSYVYE